MGKILSNTVSTRWFSKKEKRTCSNVKSSHLLTIYPPYEVGRSFFLAQFLIPSKIRTTPLIERQLLPIARPATHEEICLADAFRRRFFEFLEKNKILRDLSRNSSP
jgi:hypothetical protein